MKKIVVLTGAGISAESGIQTFRDADGLWEGHDVLEVASIDGWYKNPELVLNFYNKRRTSLNIVEPNDAHLKLRDLESDFEVQIITQNVDNLHERAGSTQILHLHGELTKMRSENNPYLILESFPEIKLGDLAADGSQLRPHIVWFGEAVPAIELAIQMVEKADILVVIGTSLQVYPAASLIDYVKNETPIYYIDANPAKINLPRKSVITWKMKATEGVQKLVATLLNS
uniref:SIR2 family NAD-dependent protein deacylase n=1 Tax=Flavobacterium sp. TaxID=239 RepID=UPI004049DFDC